MNTFTQLTISHTAPRKTDKVTTYNMKSKQVSSLFCGYCYTRKRKLRGEGQGNVSLVLFGELDGEHTWPGRSVILFKVRQNTPE